MNFSQNTPIFLQIAQLVEQNIVKEQWAEGERIASTRELAVELSVNPATVMRAYEHMTELGLVEQQRGLGYFVMAGAKERIVEIRREEFFSQTMPQFFEQMQAVGVAIDEVYKFYTK